MQSPQSGSAFTNSSSAHPIGEDQKKGGGDIAWPAAPVKVAIELVGACGCPSEIWLTAVAVETQACGWPSDIWLTAQTVGVPGRGGGAVEVGCIDTVVEEAGIDTVVEVGCIDTVGGLELLAGGNGSGEEALDDADDVKELCSTEDSDSVLCVEIDRVDVVEEIGRLGVFGEADVDVLDAVEDGNAMLVVGDDDTGGTLVGECDEVVDTTNGCDVAAFF